VLADRLLADEQPLRDRGVGPALGHQGQHLALARGEPGHRRAAGVPHHQLAHHLGIEHGAARGHGADGRGERLVVEHAVLQQVADGAGLVGQQLAGVQLLDVLGQHEHRQAGHLAAGLQRGAQPVVGVRGRQPDVHDAHVRALIH
jgi:hypothetical protein